MHKVIKFVALCLKGEVKMTMVKNRKRKRRKTTLVFVVCDIQYYGSSTTWKSRHFFFFFFLQGELNRMEPLKTKGDFVCLNPPTTRLRHSIPGVDFAI